MERCNNCRRLIDRWSVVCTKRRATTPKTGSTTEGNGVIMQWLSELLSNEDGQKRIPSGLRPSYGPPLSFCDTRGTSLRSFVRILFSIGFIHILFVCRPRFPQPAPWSEENRNSPKNTSSKATAKCGAITGSKK